MDKMIQYRKNRIRFIIRQNFLGNLTREEFVEQYYKLEAEIFLLMLCEYD
jgi:hypothetical protein